MSLSVVYLPDTGHVAGAVDVAGAPAPVDVTALVGSALPLRTAAGAEVVTLSLPARELALLQADDEPRVFLDPLAFGVEQPPAPAAPRTALVRLAEWSDELRFDGVGLVVTVPLDAGQRTPVVALVSDGQGTVALSGHIEEGRASVTLPVTVAAGPHGVLVLVAGWVGRLVEVAAP